MKLNINLRRTFKKVKDLMQEINYLFEIYEDSLNIIPNKFKKKLDSKDLLEIKEDIR